MGVQCGLSDGVGRRGIDVEKMVREMSAQIGHEK